MKYALNFETAALGDAAEFDKFAKESTNSFWELDEYSDHKCESCSEFDPEYDESEWEAEVMRGRRVPQRPVRPSPRSQRSRLRPRVIRRPGQVIAGPSICTCPAPNCPRHGSEYVRWVQSALNQIMNLRLSVTGIMTASTRSALRSFQENQGLPVDGIAGPETTEALIGAKGGKPPQVGAIKPDEPAMTKPAGPAPASSAAEFDFEWETFDNEFEDSEGIDEDASDWFDSEWDNPLESENPKSTGKVTAKGVLKRAGLKTTTRIDRKTASLIQSVLEQSLVLRPFIAAKLGKIAIPKNFVHYRSDPEFDYAYLNLNKIVVPFGSKEEKELINIRGFYHRPTDSFHFRPSANVGLALQLAINRFSSSAFRDFFGKSLYEGVGLYFTNLVLEEQGLTRIVSHPYRDQLRCATDLAGLVGRSMVGKPYFQNHLDLVRHLTTKLSIGPVRTDKLARDALCKTELLLLERFTRKHVGITDQIQFIEVTNVSASRSNGRVVMARLPDVIARMSHAKRVRFIRRFIDPMLKHSISRDTIIELNRKSQGNHVVQIAWANGQFGGNATIAIDRRAAVGGRGSGSMIFIDEHDSGRGSTPTGGISTMASTCRPKRVRRFMPCAEERCVSPETAEGMGTARVMSPSRSTTPMTGCCISYTCISIASPRL